MLHRLSEVECSVNLLLTSQAAIWEMSRLAWRFFSATAASKARRRSASGSEAKVAFSSSSGRACSQVVSPVMFASRSSSWDTED